MPTIEMATSNETLGRRCAIGPDSDCARTVPMNREDPAASRPSPALGDMRRVRANGIELNVLVAGHGPDVLLVHGFPDSHEVWRHQSYTRMEGPNHWLQLDAPERFNPLLIDSLR